MEERIPSPVAARMIGIKTQTLAKWRCQGRGPVDWIQVTPTLVTYSVRSVRAFIAGCAAATSHPR
jgi:hypothetical protein